MPNEPPALHIVLNISVFLRAIVDAATQQVRVEFGNFFSSWKFLPM